MQFQIEKLIFICVVIVTDCIFININ